MSMPKHNKGLIRQKIVEIIRDEIGSIESQVFKIPQKEVKLPVDIKAWEKSSAYEDLVGFIGAMSESVKGKKLRDPFPPAAHGRVENLLSMLQTMDSWIDEIPPIEQPQRFGNKAYRTWFDKLKENAEDMVLKALGETYTKAIPEVATYLVEGVGNQTRIDYGTGHELAFVAFLCCLFKLGALQQADAPACVLKVFNRYLELMRRLQQTYRMEPAGSMGVWNLDDFQFIPFIWGSAQIIGHPRLKPSAFAEPDMVASFHKDYMFFACIKYINEVKTGPFHEHSNQLWNISGVQTWDKVNSGLVKMYKAEVLSKFPVIQHFVFGSLLTLRTEHMVAPSEPDHVTQSTAPDHVTSPSEEEHVTKCDAAEHLVSTTTQESPEQSNCDTTSP